MYVRYQTSHNRPPAPRRGRWVPYVPGAMLLTLGVLILAVPELLVALVAAALITTGVFGLLAARRVQRFLDQSSSGYAEIDPLFRSAFDEYLYTDIRN